MPKKMRFRTGLLMLSMGLLMLGCAGRTPAPTAQNFIAPEVSLSQVEVANYFGWWFYDAKAQPVRGKAGNNGAPLDYAFVFDIKNPNPFPVLMDDFKFTVALEDFELNTVSSIESQWIPGGKTNQLRVHAMFDIAPARMSLLVTGGFKMKEKGLNDWQLLEKWWSEAPAFSYPVHVRDGAAVFRADGLVKVTPFEATYP
jgi:hypothetical protein